MRVENVLHWCCCCCSLAELCEKVKTPGHRLTYYYETNNYSNCTEVWHE